MSLPVTVAPNETKSDAAGLMAKFLGYLTADSLNYLLGFIIYGWLVRLLNDSQYGHLGVATSVYQVLMMVAALGLDLTGPRMVEDSGGNASDMAAIGQRARLKVVAFICLPATLIFSYVYWRTGRHDIAIIILAGFTMVVARAFDVTYLAVVLGKPAALAKTRALGLGIYLCLLFLAKSVIGSFVWVVPILNAIGVVIGRVQLMRMLRTTASQRVRQTRTQLTERIIALRGVKAGTGQLLLFVLWSLDVALLARYTSSEVVGQYSMVSRLYLFATAVLTALLNAYVPDLVAVATHRESLSKLFRRFLLKSAGLGLAGGLVFWLAATRACELLGHRQLLVVAHVCPYYALIYFVIGIGNPFLSLLPSLHKNGSYVTGIAISLGVLIATDLWLMPRYGAVGAAIGQLIANTFLVLFMVMSYRRYLHSIS